MPHEHFHHAARLLRCRRAAQRQGVRELFTEDGVYHDVFYGAFEGRAKIAEMIDDWFYRTATDFRWDMHDARQRRHTRSMRATPSAIARRCRRPKGARAMFEGVAIMKLRDGKISEYHEVANTAPAFVDIEFRAGADRARSSPSRARR